MSELPVSDQAVEAFEAVFYDEYPQDAPRPLRHAIQAFLKAEGATVERLTPGEACRNPHVLPEKCHCRLVTDWRPVESSRQVDDA